MHTVYSMMKIPRRFLTSSEGIDIYKLVYSYHVNPTSMFALSQPINVFMP